MSHEFRQLARMGKREAELRPLSPDNQALMAKRGWCAKHKIVTHTYTLSGRTAVLAELGGCWKCQAHASFLRQRRIGALRARP